MIHTTKQLLILFLAAIALERVETVEGGSLSVMTNAKSGNKIIHYERNETSGKLQLVDELSTGGIGGTAQAPPDDPLGSQESLVLTDSGCLIAVNAGSNTLTSFSLEHSGLRNIGVYGSGGLFPVSVAHHDNLVYVLNAGGTGSIAGFNIDTASCELSQINGAQRSMRLRNRDDPPFFVVSPAQIAFTPDGRYLVVTIKGTDPDPGAGEIRVFTVNPTGRLSRSRTTIANGFTPFSFDFDAHGNLLVTEAFGAASSVPTDNAGAVSSYEINEDGSLSVISPSIETGQTTTCWLRQSNSCVVTTNNGGNSISTMELVGDGVLSLKKGNAVGDVNAPIDASFSDDGRFLYVLSTGHTLPEEDQNHGQPVVKVFAVKDCNLSFVQTTSDGLPNEDETEFGVVGLAIN